MIPRRRFHRIVFVLAAIYNPLWGLYAALDPRDLANSHRSTPRQAAPRTPRATRREGA